MLFLALICVAIVFTQGRPVFPSASSGFFNVLDYGAKGDGIHDDTDAFRQALQAGAGKGMIFVPGGTYVITRSLVVPPGTSLQGANAYAYRACGSPGPNATIHGTTIVASLPLNTHTFVSRHETTAEILAASREGFHWGAQGIEVASVADIYRQLDNPQNGTSPPPFIFLKGPDAGIDGLAINYPAQSVDKPAVPFGPCLQGSGDDITVRNTLLLNPYIGIDLGTFPCARHTVDFVYGQPLMLGFVIDQTYDIGRVRHVHIWSFFADAGSYLGKWLHTRAVTFHIMRTDWEEINDVFSWGYNVGLVLDASSHGAMNGQVEKLNFDDVGVGIMVLHTQPYAVYVNGLNLANAGDGDFRYAVYCPPLNGTGSAAAGLRGPYATASPNAPPRSTSTSSLSFGVRGAVGNGQPAAIVAVNSLSVWGQVRAGIVWHCDSSLQMSQGNLQRIPHHDPVIAAREAEDGMPMMDFQGGSVIASGLSFMRNDRVSSTAIRVNSSAVSSAVIYSNVFNGNTLEGCNGGSVVCSLNVP